MLSRLPRLCVDRCQRHAWPVLLTAALLCVLGVIYTVRNLGMDTDTGHLFPDDLPWRQRSAAFDAAFPQNDGVLVVVIDASTPEQADAASDALATRLAGEALVKHVRRPGGGEFFKRNGLLYLDLDELTALAARVVESQALLGALAHDLTLRGLFETLARAGEAATRGEFDWQRLVAPLNAIAETLESARDGHPRPLSWRSLVSGQPADADALRRFLLVQPVLDYGALMPGAKASAAVRAAARELGLSQTNGVRVRLTGSVALSDEEFASVAEGTGLAALLSVSLVTVLLILGVGSLRLVLAIVVTLFAGIVATFAFATAAVGSLNLISIAFVVLFVGLAVDFGIQFCVRYREESTRHADVPATLEASADAVGPALALAAAATSAGFLALTPTDYAGVGELGLIAGAGLGIALLLNLTLLPALITVLRPPPGRGSSGFMRAARLDRLLVRRRRGVLVVATLTGIAGLLMAPRLVFDFDPIALKDPNTESVATLMDLVGNPNATPFTIDILSPSLGEARVLATRLAALPEVDKTITAASFVPTGQAEKLAVIDDLSLLLGPLEVPASAPAPGERDAALAAIRSAIAALDAAPAGSAAATAAARLRPLLEHLPASWERLAQPLATALLGALPVVIGDLQMALGAEPVTLATLPDDLRRDWISADGRARIEVFPAGDVRRSSVLEQFTRSVRGVAPNATGAPVNIVESGRLVVGAFVEAGWIALAVVTALLFLVLRRLRDVAMVLTPLLLAGLLTVLVSALLPLPLNFANIIALPLLLGIGVSFAIYFVINWRCGERRPLCSPTARAVLFSALTTASAFGSLTVSSHPGTASMGLLLTVSLAATLVSTLLVLPALLGPPPGEST